jgi:tRNA 5-methylaminomethyl-2-thiouridine biosynthesis bifunctional protein
MLSGRYAPRRPVPAAQPAYPHERHAIVIGAGVAGAAVCERLQSRGWRVDLVEARAASPVQPAREFAGVFHPHVSPDDAIRSRIARNGFLYAIARWLALERAGRTLAWDRCGVIQVAADREQEQRIAHAGSALGFPGEYARYVTRDEAEGLAACRLRSGGWWFPGGGWMRPASLVAAQRAASAGGVQSHFATPVDRIRRDDGGWSALATNGKAIATAPVLVLANSADVQRLAAIGETLARVRGQVTYVPADRTVAPRTVITGRGYVLPPVDGIVIAGSTYDRDETDPQPQASGHQTNLLHLGRLLPEAAAGLDPSTLHGAVGFRCAAPDRMPLVGALPDVEAAQRGEADLTGAHLAHLPRHAGLYCATGFASRGLVWASLAAETLAGIIEGEPLPLESDLADALDPARFVLRRLRRGRL